MSETDYGCQCGRHHPKEEARQVDTIKWRCVKSIEAVLKTFPDAKPSVGR